MFVAPSVRLAGLALGLVVLVPRLVAAQSAQAVQATQQSLLADPEISEKIQSLQDEAVVEDILQDDDTMRAVADGDFGKLLANPKIKALAEHRTVREILEKYKR